MNATTLENVREAIDGLDYPASKDAVVEHATQQGAGEKVLGLVRALPVAIYTNREEVLAAIPFHPGSGDEDRDTQDMEDKANERRRHTHPGLAEHEKQTPRSPIEDGLGYNRGS